MASYGRRRRAFGSRNPQLGGGLPFAMIMAALPQIMELAGPVVDNVLDAIKGGTSKKVKRMGGIGGIVGNLFSGMGPVGLAKNMAANAKRAAEEESEARANAMEADLSTDEVETREERRKRKAEESKGKGVRKRGRRRGFFVL